MLFIDLVKGIVKKWYMFKVQTLLEYDVSRFKTDFGLLCSPINPSSQVPKDNKISYALGEC